MADTLGFFFMFIRSRAHTWYSIGTSSKMSFPASYRNGTLITNNGGGKYSVRGGEATAYHKVRVQFNSGIDCGDVPAVPSGELT